jgi:hypothetical protein
VIRLQPALFADLEPGRGTAPLTAALQTALRLEHSTIPPYLYALYSLVPGRNQAVASILESVVEEEMLHMTLIANLLNALGASPAVDDGAFVPHYPGPLPGSVEGDLVVGLAPCSVELVGDVFMVIEQPETPLQFPAGLTAADQLTIGEYYARIRRVLTTLDDADISGDESRQVGPERVKGSVVVGDVDAACQAIDVIVAQGEGTATEPVEVFGDQYAHYYRFAEIRHGRRLVPNLDADETTPPERRYLYAGDPVPFDPGGVYPVPTDPKADQYADGSADRYVCNIFNYTYSSLLKVLHSVFNGHPEHLDAGLGLMMSLEQQAKDMMSGSGTAGHSVGPSFEWQPVALAPA